MSRQAFDVDRDKRIKHTEFQKGLQQRMMTLLQWLFDAPNTHQKAPGC